MFTHGSSHPSLPPLPSSTLSLMLGSQVTVLEARSRVGGRMWSRTETVNGNVLRADMGAQWIQSATGGNPITALARQMKLPIGKMNGEEQQYTVSGKAYSDSDTNKAYSAYQSLAKKAIKYANNQDNDISLDQAFRAVDSNLYLTPFVQVGGIRCRRPDAVRSLAKEADTPSL